ncbi:MAG: alpha/beta hydrolase [Vicinamibacterales bacterium]
MVVLTLALLVVAAAVGVGWRCRTQALAWVQPPRTAGADAPPATAPPGTSGGWLTATDGTRLRYWFVPGGGAPPHPAVVLLHGLTANRDAMLPRAAVLARHGISSLALELRGHGASGGDYTTLGEREPGDVAPALAWLTARADVDRNRLALLGHSLGAIVALRAAAAQPAIGAVVAESAFVSIAAIAPAVITGLSGRRPMPSAGVVLWTMDRITGAAPSRVRVDDVVPTLDQPLLFVHGSLDPLAPADGATRLAGLARNGTLALLPGAAHADLLERDPAGYQRAVTAFLGRAWR